MARLTTDDILETIRIALTEGEYAGMEFDIPDDLAPNSEVAATFRYRPDGSAPSDVSLAVTVNVGHMGTRILTIYGKRTDGTNKADE